MLGILVFTAFVAVAAVVAAAMAALYLSNRRLSEALAEAEARNAEAARRLGMAQQALRLLGNRHRAALDPTDRAELDLAIAETERTL